MDATITYDAFRDVWQLWLPGAVRPIVSPSKLDIENLLDFADQK
jgi:hypothetical protein